jgi:protein-tyrosine-phosphatase
MNDPIAVLFLCTHNSARSILAEALLNHLGSGRFIGYSAGSTPRANGLPNPLGLQALTEAGIQTAHLSSKSWDTFTGTGAPHLDLVVTVCGAASDVCPIFPGGPAKVHWGYADPSAGDAPDEIKLEAFRATLAAIRRRIEAFVGLPDEALRGPRLLDSARQLAEV